MSKPNARDRAAAHFFEALERASTLDGAWRVVLSAPKPPAPGAELYARLSQFLKSLAPPTAASKSERAAYLALIRRFLKSEAMDEATARRAILALRDAEKGSD